MSEPIFPRRVSTTALPLAGKQGRQLLHNRSRLNTAGLVRGIVKHKANTRRRRRKKSTAPDYSQRHYIQVQLHDKVEGRVRAPLGSLSSGIKAAGMMETLWISWSRHGDMELGMG
jgi:hypothetical protein